MHIIKMSFSPSQGQRFFPNSQKEVEDQSFVLKKQNFERKNSLS